MFNPLHIAEGYYRDIQLKLGALPPHIEKFALRRFATCIPCVEFNSKNDKCELCRCDMKIKTLVAGAWCPMGKWDQEINENKLVQPGLQA